MRQILRHKLTIVFLFFGILILLFILMPLVKMVIASDAGILWDTFKDDQVRDAIWLTIKTALIATVIGLILGVPLAYVLARHNFPGKRIVEGVIDLPIVVPHTAAGIALLFIFGRKFFMGQLFEPLGIEFVGAEPGIVVAMLFVSVPFLVDSAKEGFKAVDPRLEKVARTLGASPLQTFARISLPLARRSIMAGSVMMWARGLSEFGAVIILAYHPMIAPILTYERFESYGLEYSRPVAVLLILIALVVFITLRTIVYRGEKS